MALREARFLLLSKFFVIVHHWLDHNFGFVTCLRLLSARSHAHTPLYRSALCQGASTLGSLVDPHCSASAALTVDPHQLLSARSHASQSRSHGINPSGGLLFFLTQDQYIPTIHEDVGPI